MVPLAGLLMEKLFLKNWWGAIPPFSGWLLAGIGVSPRIFLGDSSHFWGWHLAKFGVTPSREASSHCYNLAHIYVSWSYVWKYTNVKLTLLPIKTISRCLTIFVLQIFARNLLRWAILKSSIYFYIGFKLNGKFFSTYDCILYVLLQYFTALYIKTICRALSLLVLKILAVYWDPRY